MWLLFSKENTKKEIRQRRRNNLSPIDFNAWYEYIEKKNAFYWYINSPLGILDKNEPEAPLDPIYYYRRAFFEYNKKDEWSDTIISFVNLKNQYIKFQFPRITLRRLDMMWEMANALDCHLVKDPSTFITEEKYLKLREKYDRSKKKAK